MLQPQWGLVVTHIVPDPAIVGRAFLSCINTWLSADNHWSVDAAVLLDGAHPGARPAPMPGMTPVAGHPGDFNRQLGVVGDITARRVAAAWLVVQGSGLAQRLTALKVLTVGPIDLRPSPPTQRGACRIGHGPLASLIEAGAKSPPPGLLTRAGLSCAVTVTYLLHRWPISAAVSLYRSGRPPPVPRAAHPVPGHSGTFSLHEGGPFGDVTFRRQGSALLSVTGGRDTQQRLALLGALRPVLRRGR